MNDSEKIPQLAVKPITVGRILDCGMTTVYQLIKEGRLRTVPFGADRRVLMEDVRRLVSEGWRRP